MAYNWDSLAGVDTQDGEWHESESKPLAPVGMHKFTVRSAEGKRGKESDLPYINLCLRLGDGEYSDVYAILPLPDDARKSNSFLEQQLVAFCDVVGVPRDKIGAMIADLSTIEFKTGLVVLQKDSYNNPVTGETIEKRKANWLKSDRAQANAKAKEMREAPREEFEAKKSAAQEAMSSVADKFEGTKEPNDAPW